ncbi:hypothetical protein ACYJ1Y_01975 [Natrialbaceae archaeon A-gly3]
MQTELLVEAFTLLVYAALAGLLTAGGFVLEYTSLQYLSSGETVVALWLAAFGAVMLYAGVYGLGYGKVLARVV